MCDEQEINGDYITKVLKEVLEELNQPPYGLLVDIEEYDPSIPKWLVSISRFSAQISGNEIREAESRCGDIYAAMKNLIFEKFQWAVCEV